ncbi:hypothetical protein EAO71_05690 [Streptomyces sp. ms191]|uniref:hypothetical protein n=1 Tax=Streptomyces sp. ms191 TaxID=1827978 RepID=UPI0011CDD2BB|nr:hypothetical protein [Streptomyces sp. ms191]TXS32323.1 hypothetical protein EAO71_05690 [Streptomyces sp. ms191]
MSPAPAHHAEPAAPAGGRTRADRPADRAPGIADGHHRARFGSGFAGHHRARRAVLVLGLVLAALFGVCGGAAGASGGELRPAASAAPDPGGEAHEVAETEATSPRRAAVRPRGGQRSTRRSTPGPGLPARGAPAAVRLPGEDADGRCVVMRC